MRIQGKTSRHLAARGGGEGGRLWHPSEQGAERCCFVLEFDLQSKDFAFIWRVKSALGELGGDYRAFHKGSDTLL